MSYLNKKGVSGVIESVLLTLLAITFVGVLSVSIINTVNIPELSPDTSCLLLKSQSPISIKTSCYNQDTNNIETIVQRQGRKINVKSLDFITTNKEETTTFSCGPSCKNCKILPQDTTREYLLYSEEKPNKIILRVNDCLLDSQEIQAC